MKNEPAQDDVEDGVPLLVGHAVEPGVARQPGVVDEDVQPAELGLGRRDDRVRCLGRADAPDRRDRGPPRFPDRRRDRSALSRVEIVDDHGGPAQRQLECDARPIPLPAPVTRAPRDPPRPIHGGRGGLGSDDAEQRTDQTFV